MWETKKDLRARNSELREKIRALENRVDQYRDSVVKLSKVADKKTGITLTFYESTSGTSVKRNPDGAIREYTRYGFGEKNFPTATTMTETQMGGEPWISILNKNSELLGSFRLYEIKSVETHP